MTDEMIYEGFGEETVVRYALNLSENGRILSATYEQYAPVGAILADVLPTGETEKEKDISNWLYRNGGYVYDPIPASGEAPAAPSIEERVTSLEEANAEMTEALDLILSGVTE